MIKIVSIIGARPQIIKSAAVSRVFKNLYPEAIEEVVVHTGQHYDENMSEVFFRELEIEREKYNLQIGSGSHAVQTAKMMLGIEEVLLKEKPAALLLYGDTNSTLAGAVVAAKMHIPVIHIEAGVRSVNKTNPEELNRIVTDHYSSLLFYYTHSAAEFLEKEGFNLHNKAPFSIDNPGVYQCGDIMYDNSLYFAQKAEKEINLLQTLGLEGKPFALATVHRDVNTDIPHRLHGCLKAFDAISKEFEMAVLLPMHPRTTKIFQQETDRFSLNLLEANPRLRVLPPATYLQMVAMESKASLILTDSGGVQREAFFFKKPCILLNDETPWPELLEGGSTLIGGTEAEAILKCARTLLNPSHSMDFLPIFGDGQASEFIASVIYEQFSNR